MIIAAANRDDWPGFRPWMATEEDRAPCMSDEIPTGEQDEEGNEIMGPGVVFGTPVFEFPYDEDNADGISEEAWNYGRAYGAYPFTSLQIAEFDASTFLTFYYDSEDWELVDFNQVEA